MVCWAVRTLVTHLLLSDSLSGKRHERGNTLAHRPTISTQEVFCLEGETAAAREKCRKNGKEKMEMTETLKNRREQRQETETRGHAVGNVSVHTDSV